MTELHVVFGLSAAGSLQSALEMSGKPHSVIGMPDDLSFGPIDLISAETRSTWNREVLGYDDEDARYGFSDDQLWAEVTRGDVVPTAWLHRRCAREYSNFLQFLSRLNGAPCKIVDVTDVDLVVNDGRRDPSRSLGEVAPARILDADLLERQTFLLKSERIMYRERGAP